MNTLTTAKLERHYKDACALLQEVMFNVDTSNMDKNELKAHRQALARARFGCEMAQIELDAAWTPPAEWFAKVA